jgi:hypothetical protein
MVWFGALDPSVTVALPYASLLAQCVLIDLLIYSMDALLV